MMTIFLKIAYRCFDNVKYIRNCRIFSQRIRSMSSNEGSAHSGILLKLIIDSLVNFAPLNLAESWDNVGLLVEPACDIYVKNILLTNDLTQDVLEEAVKTSTDLIISYHPLIFPHYKCITRKSWKEHIISECLLNKIAVYSPHTTWDVVTGGVNDWLINAFKVQSIKPITPKENIDNLEYIVTVDAVNATSVKKILESEQISGTHFPVNESSMILPVERFVIQCKKYKLKSFLPMIANSCDVVNFNVVLCDKASKLESNIGIGRLCKLEAPITINEAIRTVKQHLNISHVQVALARGCTLDTKISTVAVCAGSGGSVLRDTEADLKLSGEASHHEVLDSVHRGSSYILTHHSNSERGFLTEFKQSLQNILNNNEVNIMISKKDRDPLSIM